MIVERVRGQVMRWVMMKDADTSIIISGEREREREREMYIYAFTFSFSFSFSCLSLPYPLCSND